MKLCLLSLNVFEESPNRVQSEQLTYVEILASGHALIMGGGRRSPHLADDAHGLTDILRDPALSPTPGTG